jgi:hypothetical protein
MLYRTGSVRCGHIVQYRGNVARDQRYTIMSPGVADSDEVDQLTVHLYQGWAGCGDLQNTIDQHRRLERLVEGRPT